MRKLKIWILKFEIPVTYISGIWNRTSRLIWLNGAEWVILSSCTLVCQQVEQRALSHIGKSHAAHLKVGPDAPKGYDIGLFLNCFLWRHCEWGIDGEAEICEAQKDDIFLVFFFSCRILCSTAQRFQSGLICISRRPLPLFQRQTRSILVIFELSIFLYFR